MPIAGFLKHIVGQQRFAALGDKPDNMISQTNLRSGWQFKGGLG